MGLQPLLEANAHLVSAHSWRQGRYPVNTYFRSLDEWVELFAQAGFQVEGRRIGRAEHVAPPLRMLLIRTIRRDSFLLRAKVSA